MDNGFWIKKVCKNCNKEFFIKRHRLNDKKVRRGLFCCRVCYHKYSKGRKRKKRGPMPIKWKEKISLGLKGIISHRKGKTYEEEYGKKKSDKIKQKISNFFNGKPLSEESKRKMSENSKHNPNYGMKGKNHSEKTKEKISMSQTKEKIFTGFKRSKNGRIRMSKNFKEWRKAVFERDGYTCQNPNCLYCHNKKKNVYLNPHHIKSFAKYPELRFDVNNGITYCKDYHIKGGLHKNGK